MIVMVQEHIVLGTLMMMAWQLGLMFLRNNLDKPVYGNTIRTSGGSTSITSKLNALLQLLMTLVSHPTSLHHRMMKLLNVLMSPTSLVM